jgi:diguanylate cyclase (GGDEF)-like protein/PAS domain S-box-containing protein
LREAVLGFLLIVIASTEALVLAGAPPSMLSPALTLAVGIAVYAGGLAAGVPAILFMLAYGFTRAWAVGTSFTDPGFVGFVFTAGLLAPAMMFWLRRSNDLARRWARIYGRHQAWGDAGALRRQHQAFLNGLEALVWEMDPVTGEVRLINSYAETRLGFRGSGTGKAARFSWESVHPDDQAGLKDVLGAVLTDGRPRHFEYRVRASDGYSVWIRDNISLVRGAHGSKLQGLGIDISLRRRAEEELFREKERYRDLFNGVPVGLYRLSPRGDFLVVNDALVRMFGYSAQEEFEALEVNGVFSESSEHWRWQKALLQTGDLRSFELPCRRKEGQQIWVRNTARGVRDAIGEIAYYEGVLEDITDRKRAEAAEKNAEEKFRGLVEQSLVGICMVQDDLLVYVNPKMSEIFGYSAEELLLLRSANLLAAEDSQIPLKSYFAQRLTSGGSGPLAFQGRRKDGSVIEVEIHCTRTTFNEKPAVLGTLVDITSRKEAEDRLFHAAFHDPLTGLPNRILFMDRLQHALQRQRRGTRFAVLFLDLNRFKVVNDSLGHPAGDELLRVVAQRLQTCLRMGDSVARFGGDEFALLLEEIGDPADAIHVAERVQEAMSAPMTLGEHEVFTGASIGIALSSESYEKADDILRNADMAMYRAKSSGISRYEIFDEAMYSEALERLRMETHLQRGVEREEFYLHYQPIVCLSTGDLLGFEALARWSHPELGSVTPETFMSLAEEMGLIVPIGRQLLRMACAQAEDWRRRFPEEAGALTMSVNLSTRQIQGSSFIEDIQDILAETGLPPANLKLEITESAIMDDRVEAASILATLKRIGVGVLLDDFGTGYSSLGYLHSLPIDTLKIDRSFVMRLDETESSEHLVRTILNVAHNLRMTVVAEGVETESHVIRMRELGCEYAQGYCFSPPRAPEEIERIIRIGRFPMPSRLLERVSTS